MLIRKVFYILQIDKYIKLLALIISVFTVSCSSMPDGDLNRMTSVRLNKTSNNTKTFSVSFKEEFTKQDESKGHKEIKLMTKNEVKATEIFLEKFSYCPTIDELKEAAVNNSTDEKKVKFEHKNNFKIIRRQPAVYQDMPANLNSDENDKVLIMPKTYFGACYKLDNPDASDKFDKKYSNNSVRKKFQ